MRTDHPKRVLFVCRANVRHSAVTGATSSARAEDGAPLTGGVRAVGPLAGKDAAANAHGPRGGRYLHSKAPRSAGGRGDAGVGGPRAWDELVAGRASQPASRGPIRWALRLASVCLAEYTLGAPDEGIPNPYALTLSACGPSVRQLIESLVGCLGWETFLWWRALVYRSGTRPVDGDSNF